MLLGVTVILAYASVFFVRGFSGGGCEIGVATLKPREPNGFS